eukprot:gnl/Dysnectes_brevis/1941_a2230_1834.p1 GENE.gnl/Dysnectes_brevis/1941_a2230_1834~~gnl/Dysnectes_brevis/1941_a2230_1834.p1  ORF type:complete len:342 (+),score=99.70 gnl/Dysnectes_brevis/1941_a2230_1834:84-1109(+)
MDSDEKAVKRQQKGESWRSRRELEVARKTGHAPAAVDAYTGQEINPHVPRFVREARWYVDSGVETMQHQALESREKPSLPFTTTKVTRKRVVTRWKPGCCTNCGASGHTSLECLEMPRKRTAGRGRRTSREMVQRTGHRDSSGDSWDVQHDQWAGYDSNRLARRQAQLLERQKAKEAASKVIRTRKARSTASRSVLERLESLWDSSDEEDSVSDSVVPRGREDCPAWGSSLASREDVPVYMLNLEGETPFYDPASHAMRRMPLDPGDARLLAVGFRPAGSGAEPEEMVRAERLGVVGAKTGKQIHLQAAPSRTARATSVVTKQLTEARDARRRMLEDEYGA